MTEKSNVIKFFFDNDGKVVDFCTLSNQEMTLEQVIEEEDGYGGNRMRIESDFLDKKYRITEGTCLYHL